MKKALMFFFGLFLAAQVINLTSMASAEWASEVALGFTNTNGNTDKSSLNLEGQTKEELDVGEILLKGNLYIASSENKQDAKNWNLLGRYAYDFGQDDRLFNSYQLTIEHDRFANLDARYTPSVGIGYHIFRKEDANNGMVWMAEIGLGYEINRYRDATPNDEEVVAIGHTYFEMPILDNATFSEDFTVTPSLEESGVKVKSETGITNPISENMDLRLRYILEHDTDPVPGVKKTDTQIITDIRYKF